MCLIRLKSSLADSVVGVIEKNGGLSISGKALNLQALTGENSKMEWKFLGFKLIRDSSTQAMRKD